MDKWLEEFGIYDFLGVICPGIFAIGLFYIFDHINNSLNCFNEIIRHVGVTPDATNLQYFFYIYIIVVIYIFGSFIHEIGHIFSEIYSTGLSGILDVLENAIEKQLPKCFGDGNSEAENTFLLFDMSNSNKKERETWLELMNNTKSRDRYPYKINLNFETKTPNDIEDAKLKSAAFYQHCKRYVSYKGYGRTSKKKDAIYGLSRNVSWMFLVLLITLVVFCNMGKFDTTYEQYYVQCGIYSLFAFVFGCKFVRYKNMEVIDVIRTYKCLVENEKDKGELNDEKAIWGDC